MGMSENYGRKNFKTFFSAWVSCEETSYCEPFLALVTTIRLVRKITSYTNAPALSRTVGNKEKNVLLNLVEG
jgi:hypothetical protein